MICLSLQTSGSPKSRTLGRFVGKHGIVDNERNIQLGPDDDWIMFCPLYRVRVV